MIPPQLLAGGALLLTVVGFGTGYQVRDWKCDAALKKALEHQFTEFQEQLARQNTEATEYERDRELARQESRVRETTIREIYRDVPAPPASCEPPAGVIGVLNDEIRAANARAAGKPVESLPTD